MRRLLLAIALLTLPTLLDAQDHPAGDWTGTIEAGALRLRLVVHLTGTDGAWTGTMDSPDQGVDGLPLAEVQADGRGLTFTVPSIQGRYEGSWTDGGRRVQGTWSQGAASLPLTLERATGPVAREPRPQEPVGALPYEVSDVSFAGGAADVTLAGTLTLPPGSGPFPAVVLISGSGPQDRDETLLGHKPFLVLADHFTRAGIAVLRYDDRGVAGSTGTFAAATSEDFTEDAAAAVRFLAARPEIDPARIGLVGHSEGGLVAPLVETRHGGVAFLVLMAGPGLPGHEILELQTGLILEANGASAEQVAAAVARTRELDRMILEAGDDRGLETRLVARIEAMAQAMGRRERAAQGLTPEAIRAQARELAGPWFRFFLAYDPVPTLRAVDVPVLAVNGAKDLQVPSRANLDAIAEALLAGGNADVTTRVLPGLNHLFQTAGTGSPAEYTQIEETVAPAALELMTGWILERFGG
ncbi:MAG: alpha/beta hydrolase [Gemmatimonadota bacterium]